MAFDALKNFAYAQVLGAPNPGGSGTSLQLAAGQGAALPAVPFNAVVYPAGAIPLASNAEIVRVTGVVGDAVTAMTRQQEGTAARNIGVGDQFVAAITAKTLTDIQNAIVAAVGGTGSVGNGPPEGAVIGNPGALYVDALTAPVFDIYVKLTGVGTNTGWIKPWGA
jgi:hypothetical protein